MFDNNPFRDYKNWLRSLKEENKTKEPFNGFTGQHDVEHDEEHEENLPEEPTPHYDRISREIDAAGGQEEVHEVLKRNSKDLHPDHLEQVINRFEKEPLENNYKLFSYMVGHAASDKLGSHHQNKLLQGMGKEGTRGPTYDTRWFEPY